MQLDLQALCMDRGQVKQGRHWLCVPGMLGCPANPQGFSSLYKEKAENLNEGISGSIHGQLEHTVQPSLT